MNWRASVGDVLFGVVLGAILALALVLGLDILFMLFPPEGIGI